MFKKLNKNLLGLVAFFGVAVVALFFANQTELYKGSVTSGDRCEDTAVEEYALELLEEIYEVEGDDFDDVEDESNDIYTKLQALALMFDETDFEFDTEDLFLNDYGHSLHIAKYRNQIINSVNDILVDNKCDTFDNSDIEIDDFDFPEEFERITSGVYGVSDANVDAGYIAKFTLELDQDIEGRRIIDEDTDDEVGYINVNDHVEVKFYAGDSESDVKDENYVFRANQITLNEDEAEDTREDDIGDYEYQFYEGNVVDFYINGVSGNYYYFGNKSYSFIPVGEYMIQVVIDGYEYEPEKFELKGGEVDVCELITEDAEMESYSSKGFLEVLIDKNEDLVGMDEDEAEDHDYSYLNEILTTMRDNYIYTDASYYNFGTEDYREARGVSFGSMEALIAIAVDNGCEIDFEDFEDIDSDFIDVDVDGGKITVEFDDELDDLDFLKGDWDEDDGWEFDEDGDFDAVFDSIANIGKDDYYRNTYNNMLDRVEVEQNEKFTLNPKYLWCSLRFEPCKFDEYLVRLGVGAGRISSSSIIFDADYIVYPYLESDDFELESSRLFYDVSKEYELEFSSSDSSFDGEVEVTGSIYSGDDEFTMLDGKGTYSVKFLNVGYQQLVLKEVDGSMESRIGFYALSGSAYNEARRVLGGEEECALHLDQQGPFVSRNSNMIIDLSCNEDSARTVLNLYDDVSDQAKASIYYCLSDSQCGSNKSIVWDGTFNGVPINNGKYYFKVSYEIDGEKVVPERSETFIINHSGTVLPRGAFPDVPTNHPYLNGINWMRSQGFIQGYPDGTFGPERCVQRAELVKMVGEATGQLGQSAVLQRIFPDVEPNDWFFPYVVNATNRNWVQGYSDGTFKPGQCVTRAEAIKVAMFANNLPTVQASGNQFADVTPDDWYYGLVTTASVNRLIGTNHVVGGNFLPNQSMTRAEVAEMLFRMGRSNVGGEIPYGSAPGNPYGGYGGGYAGSNYTEPIYNR